MKLGVVYDTKWACGSNSFTIVSRVGLFAACKEARASGDVSRGGGGCGTSFTGFRGFGNVGMALSVGIWSVPATIWGSNSGFASSEMSGAGVFNPACGPSPSSHNVRGSAFKKNWPSSNAA